MLPGSFREVGHLDTESLLEKLLVPKIFVAWSFTTARRGATSGALKDDGRAPSVLTGQKRTVDASTNPARVRGRPPTCFWV